MTSGPLLVREATSSLPQPLGWALIAWILTVLIVRHLVLVERRAVDWAVLTLVSMFVLTGVLREPWVQSVLMPGISLGTIRVLTHTAAIAAAAAILVIGLLWSGIVLNWRLLLPTLGVGVLVASACLYWLALPAARSGQAVEELRSWRTGAYMVVYSLATPIACVVVARTALAHVRRHTTWSRTVFGVAVLICVAGSTLDHLTRMVSGLILATGHTNGFTEARSESNDLLFLPVVALLACIGFPSIVSAVRVRLGKDAAARHVRTLTPMWSTLVAATTGSVGVPIPGDVPVSSAFIEHRMFVEIEDAVSQLISYAPGALDEESPQKRARALRAAAERAAAAEVPTRASARELPTWLHREEMVLAVAAAWNEQSDESWGQKIDH